MKISKNVRSTIQPELKESNDYFIYIRENIQESKEIFDDNESIIYIYDEYEYTKDEYINKMESEQLEFQTTQNRILLSSKFTADRGEFRIDVMNTTLSEITSNIDIDTFNLTKSVILVGSSNYDISTMEYLIDFYTIVGKFDFYMANELFNIIESQNL